MTGDLQWVALILMIGWCVCVLWWRGTHRVAGYVLGIAISAYCTVVNPWPANAVNAACVLILAASWWRHRRRRDRAPRFYGAKSRARVAALLTKARTALKPWPALKPAPQHMVTP
jgi:hypothetical protein